MEQGARGREQGARDGEPGFRRIIAWQRADDLASAVYRMADSIPHRDRWLRSQLLSATVSVSSNIAEGHGRGTLRDYIRFLEIAISSLNEVESQLHFIRRNEIVDSALIEAIDPTRIEVGKLLTGLLRAMRARLNEGGDWQRHKVSDARGEYRAEVDDLFMDEQDWLPAPGS